MPQKVIAFNQDNSSWVTSNVTRMTGMVSGVISLKSELFHLVIGQGDRSCTTSSVTDTSHLFHVTDIYSCSEGPRYSVWVTSNVTRLTGMFFVVTSEKLTTRSHVFFLLGHIPRHWYVPFVPRRHFILSRSPLGIHALWPICFIGSIVLSSKTVSLGTRIWVGEWKCMACSVKQLHLSRISSRDTSNVISLGRVQNRSVNNFLIGDIQSDWYVPDIQWCHRRHWRKGYPTLFANLENIVATSQIRQ